MQQEEMMAGQFHNARLRSYQLLLPVKQRFTAAHSSHS